MKQGQPVDKCSISGVSAPHLVHGQVSSLAARGLPAHGHASTLSSCLIADVMVMNENQRVGPGLTVGRSVGYEAGGEQLSTMGI